MLRGLLLTHHLHAFHQRNKTQAKTHGRYFPDAEKRYFNRKWYESFRTKMHRETKSPSERYFNILLRIEDRFTQGMGCYVAVTPQSSRSSTACTHWVLQGVSCAVLFAPLQSTVAFHPLVDHFTFSSSDKFCQLPTQTANKPDSCVSRTSPHPWTVGPLGQLPKPSESQLENENHARGLEWFPVEPLMLKHVTCLIHGRPSNTSPNLLF